jgi:mono/diheme cytochrome c family protein
MGGDPTHGKQLYDTSCAECHGTDGKKIVFYFEGTNAYLGALAVLDPWRFLHKTRFGTPGTPMVIGYNLGWKPQDGRDVLLYAQSLPASQAPEASASPPDQLRATPTPAVTGPANPVFTVLLTALGVLTGIILLTLVLRRRR